MTFSCFCICDFQSQEKYEMLFVLFILFLYTFFRISFNISLVCCAVLYPHEEYIISNSFFEFVASQLSLSEIKFFCRCEKRNVTCIITTIVRKSLHADIVGRLRPGTKKHSRQQSAILALRTCISTSIALIIRVQYSLNICSG